MLTTVHRSCVQQDVPSNNLLVKIYWRSFACNGKLTQQMPLKLKVKYLCVIFPWYISSLLNFDKIWAAFSNLTPAYAQSCYSHLLRYHSNCMKCYVCLSVQSFNQINQENTMLSLIITAVLVFRNKATYGLRSHSCIPMTDCNCRKN